MVFVFFDLSWISQYNILLYTPYSKDVCRGDKLTWCTSTHVRSTGINRLIRRCLYILKHLKITAVRCKRHGGRMDGDDSVLASQMSLMKYGFFSTANNDTPCIDASSAVYLRIGIHIVITNLYYVGIRHIIDIYLYI